MDRLNKITYSVTRLDEDKNEQSSSLIDFEVLSRLINSLENVPNKTVEHKDYPIDHLFENEIELKPKKRYLFISIFSFFCIILPSCFAGR